MTKFIIIDNSIVDTVGHHYQYAAHCLKAAVELGYLTFLATNKTYLSSQSAEWKLHPVYSYGFWERKDSTFLKLFSNMNRKLLTKGNSLRYKAAFSWIGFSWENRKLLLSKTDLPGERAINNPIPWIILSSVAVPLFMIYSRANNRLDKVKRSIFHLLSSVNPRDPVSGTPIEPKRSKTFYKDTQNLFERIKLEKGDIVFIPNLGLTELLGLLEYFKKSAHSNLPSWHVLFRRNIYTGRETEYWRQDERIRVLRNILYYFIQNLQGQKVFFYTDTEELTFQYNRSGMSSFYTLPIPHTVPPAVHQFEADKSLYTLVISYIGDARTEKGYQFLPHVVRDLWSEYVLHGKVRFIFQSNFNIPKGEPKIVVARSELESLPSEQVELIYNPLSFEDYLKLLLKSNIVILPYDRENYFARSSGILVECLAAGIPVLVPSATWLSRQFVLEIYRHHRSLYEQMKVNEQFVDSELSWERSHSKAVPFVNGELIFGGESTKAYCWLEKPISSIYLYVSFNINAPTRSCIQIDLAQLRYDKTETEFNAYLVENLNDEQEEIVFPTTANTTAAITATTNTTTAITATTNTTTPTSMPSIFLPLKSDCHRIWLGFKNAFEKKAIRLNKIHIAFLEPKQTSRVYPMGAVGLCYNNPNEISDLLRDMIDNYQHYRKSALAFSHQYLKVHNAKHLVEEIQNKAIKVV